MLPARPKISGGSDKIAKKAASAARPVTRWRKHDPIVEARIRHDTCLTLTSVAPAGAVSPTVSDATPLR